MSILNTYFVCIFDDCKYITQQRSLMKKHLINGHKIENSKYIKEYTNESRRTFINIDRTKEGVEF